MIIQNTGGIWQEMITEANNIADMALSFESITLTGHEKDVLDVGINAGIVAAVRVLERIEKRMGEEKE